jgi:hypothetical protein
MRLGGKSALFADIKASSREVWNQFLSWRSPTLPREMYYFGIVSVSGPQRHKSAPRAGEPQGLHTAPAHK